MANFDFGYSCKKAVYLDQKNIWVFEGELFKVTEVHKDSILMKCTYGLNKGKVIHISHGCLAEHFTTVV